MKISFNSLRRCTLRPTLISVLVLILNCVASGQTTRYAGHFERLTKANSTDKVLSIRTDGLRLFKSLSEDNTAVPGRALLEFVQFEKAVINRLKDLLGESRAQLNLIEQLERVSREYEKRLESEISRNSSNFPVSILAELRIEYAAHLETNQFGRPQRDSNYDERRKLQARTQLKEARSLLKNVPDRCDPLVLLSDLQLAKNYMDASEFEEAIPLIENSLQALGASKGGNAAYLVVPLSLQRRILRMTGETERLELVSERLGNEFKVGADDTLLSLRGRVVNKNVPGFTELAGEIHIDGDPDLRSVDPSIPGGSRGISGDIKLATGVPVEITVDENGNIVDAILLTEAKSVEKSIRANLAKWKFRPLIYNGRPVPMRGIVHYWVRR